jgi:hypothetical protein
LDPLPPSAVAAIELGTPTNSGRRYHSSAFPIIDHSSTPVIELAGGGFALDILTVLEPAPRECIMSEGHTAECDHRAHGYEFHGSLLELFASEKNCNANVAFPDRSP